MEETASPAGNCPRPDIEGLIQTFLEKVRLRVRDVPTAFQRPRVALLKSAPSAYLDTKDWVALAKARTGHPDGVGFLPTYRALRELVEAGKVRILLSSSSYMELHRAIGSERQRTDLGAVMGELSGFRALAPRSHMLEMQVDQALHDALGRPMFPTKKPVFGHGFHFAFRGIEARLRASGESFLVGALGEEVVGRLLFQMAEITEYVVLRGASPEDVHEMKGYDLAPILAMEKERLQREKDLARMLAADPTLKRRLDDIVWARELFWELGTELPLLLGHAGTTMEAFFLKDKQWLKEFLARIPSLAVQRALRHKAFSNASREWQINEIRDFDHMSQAVPYCDIVVTDKHASSTLRAAKLDARFGTIVLSDLKDMPSAVLSFEKASKA